MLNTVCVLDTDADVLLEEVFGTDGALEVDVISILKDDNCLCLFGLGGCGKF